MTGITTGTRITYHAKTANKTFLTLKAAINSEAAAIMRKKYPTVTGCADDGWYSFHWSQDSRLVRVNFRLKRMLHSKFKRNANATD